MRPADEVGRRSDRRNAFVDEVGRHSGRRSHLVGVDARRTHLFSGVGCHMDRDWVCRAGYPSGSRRLAGDVGAVVYSDRRSHLQAQGLEALIEVEESLFVWDVVEGSRRPSMSEAVGAGVRGTTLRDEDGPLYSRE